MLKTDSRLPKLFAAFLTLCAFTQINSALAHHAVAPHYDLDSEIVIERAVVSELKMVNPHSYIYFETVSENGDRSDWRCSLRPAVALRRQGWTDETFFKGQIITIKGNPARREDNVCLVKTITFSDGTEIGPTTTLNGSPPSRNYTNAVAVDSSNRSGSLVHGQPNISGNWVSMSFGRGGLGGQSRLPNNGFDPTEANLAAAESYDVRFDDPAIKCHPINVIQGWNHDVNVNQITQLEDQVILTYGWMDFVRTIHLGREHPDDIWPSIGGHSIGSWEDNVLVVDTIGFLPGVLSHRIGILHSEEMHIVERFYYDEASRELVRDYVIEDPLYLNTPYVGQDRQRMSAVPYAKYDCTELSGDNNIRPES